MTPYFKDAQLSVFNADALAALQSMQSESVQCCVTSPPYFGLPPYYGIMRIWQIKLNQTANSRRANAEVLQRSSRKANTGDHTSRIGTKNGSLKSTSKSSGQQVRSRRKSDAQMRTFCSGLRSIRFHVEVSGKREQSSIGASKVKPTQCMASEAAQTTTGRADARQNANLSTRQKSGRKPAPSSGNATRLRASGAAHIRAWPGS